MSADKYPSIFSRQMEAIVYLARDSEPIRLLKTPRSPSVYILTSVNLQEFSLPSIKGCQLGR